MTPPFSQGGSATLDCTPDSRWDSVVTERGYVPRTSRSRFARDEKSGRIRRAGKDDDPMMKAMGHTKEFVHVLDLRGRDEYAVEVWFVDTRTAERKEFKYVDHTFKRKK